MGQLSWIKKLSPGACLYQQNLFGISPPISVADAGSIAKDGYKTMLENLIKMFKDGCYSWVKQREVFLLHLLDDMIAFPITIYHLDKSGDHTGVENRVKEVLTYMYASACSMCLDSAKRNKLMPVCNNFCKDCFSGRAICKAHEGIYDTWNCDKRQCESCNEKIKNGDAITCTRSRILLSISNQESAYEKFGQGVSQTFQLSRFDRDTHGLGCHLMVSRFCL